MPDFSLMVWPSEISFPSPSTSTWASDFSVSSGASIFTDGSLLASAPGFTSIESSEVLEPAPQAVRASTEAVTHTARTLRTDSTFVAGSSFAARRKPVARREDFFQINAGICENSNSPLAKPAMRGT